MNKTKINSIFLIFLFLVSIFSVINVTSSTGQNVPIAQAVSSTYNYTIPLVSIYEITLYNNQTVSTVPGFQQILQLNLTQLSISNLGGIRFYDSNGNKLYGWLESYNSISGVAVIWVNLGNNIIPANGTLNIFLVYNPILNFDGIYWGENSTLSTTYGQYDNGIYVFSYYQQFGSLAELPTNWYASSSSAYTFYSTYIQINSPPSNSQYYIYMNPIPSSMTTFPTVWEFYGYMFDADSGNINCGLQSTINNYSYGLYVSSNNILYVQVNGTSYSTGYTLPNQNTLYTMELFSPTNATILINNQIIYSNSNIPASTSSYFIFQTSAGSIAPTPLIVYWLRARIPPPNGVMPSVSTSLTFCPTTSNPISNLYANQYAVIPIGSSVNISTSPIGNVTWYVNNAVVSTNTTYYTTTFNQAGIYSIYATNGYEQSNYLNITVYDPNQVTTVEQCYIDPSSMVYISGYYQYSVMFKVITTSGTTPIIAMQIGLTSTSSSGSSYNPITVGWVLQQYSGGNFINLTSLTPVTVQNPANYTFPISVSTAGTYALSFYPLSNSSTDIQNITYLGIATSNSYIYDTNYYGLEYVNSTGSSIISTNTYVMSIVISQSMSFGNLIVIESGLPSGTAWSVTLTNNGNVFSSTTNSILIELPYLTTLTFSVSSSNPLYTPSPAMFTLNTSIFLTSPNVTKTITFYYSVPSPYIQINELPDD
ncbi:MAG: DUF2341 domain-containing protein, partial [Thermoplasmatales archaeon]